MKTIKPMRLGLLHKVFEHQRTSHLVVSLLVCFPFESPRRLLYEASLWKLAADELGANAILDECMSKQRGELLVHGRCFAPGGIPRRASSVRVQLGAPGAPGVPGVPAMLDKTLYVVGDRRWGALGMSEPEPFTEMPITWRNAFGGEGCAANPLGKGFARLQAEGGGAHPLPNVEDPKHLVKAPGDRPTPVGFEGYDLTWPQRASRMGTYDEAWVKDGFPGFARDLDYAFFNTAPPDQQIDGYFRGDERFVIENMHPQRARIEGALPGLKTRCFITQQTAEGEVFREAVTRLDTVHLFPHRERGILVFRGMLEIREHDAADVLHVLAACELMDGPRPVEHYKAVLAQRLDRKTRHLVALRDVDLAPPPENPEAPPLPDDQLSGVAALLKQEGHVKKNQSRKSARLREELSAQLDDARNRLRSHGLNPELYVPPLAAVEPPERKLPTADDLPEFVERIEDEVEQAKAKAKMERAAEEARMRAEYAKHGRDYDADMKQARKDAGGPPKFSARAEMERMQDALTMARNGGVAWPELEARLAEPSLVAQLVQTEERMRESYRMLAHHFPAASRLEGEPAERLRQEVIAGRAAGQGFAGRDLTGADLSHLDLQGIDLEGAMLECASLTGADLRGANLAGAVLARADLEGADLTGAKLAGTNLGAARLCDVKARGGVDFTDVVLVKADLSGADLTGATLTKCDLSEAVVSGADLSGVTATRLLLREVDLSDTTLSGADLQRCTFIEVNIAGVDFTGANLSGSTFISARGEGAVFRGARLDNLRLLKESSFSGADFQGASLQGANLMGARLSGSDFTGANLRGAMLNGCDLSGATLDRAVLAEAMLVRTNLSGSSLFAVDLMQAILQNGDLRGADMEKANLFGVDARGMVGDEETSLAGANVKRVSFIAARRPDEQG